MPYTIAREGGQYCVRREGIRRNLGCHNTRGEATEQISAIEANEQRALRKLAYIARKKIAEDDRVRYSWQGATVYGVVDRIQRSGTATLPNTDVSMDASEDNPVYIVSLRNADGTSRDQRVLRREGSLSVIENFPESKMKIEWIIKAVDPDELDEVFEKYMDTVNMSASELETWADTPCSKEASNSRAPIKRNLRLLRKNKDEWTNDDIDDANRTISFVARMSADDQGDPVNENCPSARDISLKNWAYDPDKANKLGIPTPPPLDVAKISVTDVADLIEKLTHVDLTPFLQQESGLKRFDDNMWVGWYSNNFEDKEFEIISEAGFKDFIRKTNAGDYPMPELWFMHTRGTRHGVAKSLYFIDHFAVAVGTFDDPKANPFVTRMKKWYDEQESVTMSHGFGYNPNEKRDNVYRTHRTYEISSLPSGSEANPFTLFVTR